MSTDTKEQGKKKRTRRNFAKDWERLTAYLDCVIRIKQPDEAENSSVKEQLRAYRDIKDFMEGK